MVRFIVIGLFPTETCFSSSFLLLFNVGVVMLETANGKEYFFPVLCVFVGDMMELLTACRQRAANFSMLKAPCYVCKIAGCNLHNHRHIAPLRTAEESDTVINASISALASGKGITKAKDALKALSHLPVTVCYLHLTSFLVTISVEWIYWTPCP